MQSSILTIETPSAFGFLDNDISPIILSGKGEIAAEEWDGNPGGLAVNPGMNISIIGGNITIDKGTYFKGMKTDYDFYAKPYEEPGSLPIGSLTANGGQINLISIVSAGEVLMNNHTFNLSFGAKPGNVSILDNSSLDVSGNGAGVMNIICNDFIASESELLASTSGPFGDSKIEINANDIIFTKGSLVQTATLKTGKGADIILNAKKSIEFSGENVYEKATGITGGSLGPGNGGNIFMKAQENVLFANGAYIKASAYKTGSGSNINIVSSGTVKFYGKTSLNECSKIVLDAYETGSGGNITIKADRLLFENGSFIISNTYGAGNLGEISLEASSIIRFTGNNTDPYINWYLETFMGSKPDPLIGGIISFVAPYSKGGNGCKINIKSSGDICLYDGAVILSGTMGIGNTKEISLEASEKIIVEGSIGKGLWCSAIVNGSYPFSNVAGNASDIHLVASELILKDGAAITASSYGWFGIKAGNAGNISINIDGNILISGVNRYGTDLISEVYSSGIFSVSAGIDNNSGSPGTITIKSKSLEIEKGGTISCRSESDFKGGNIIINTTDYISISGDSSKELMKNTNEDLPKQISGIYATSLGVQKDSGDGGRISLTTDSLYVSDKGLLSSSSIGGGNAGNIELNVNNLEMDLGVISSASSAIENGGAAGLISVKASDSIRLLNNSELTTEAVNTSSDNIHNDDLSGKISLNLNKLLYLSNSKISTSVKGGSGKGGDIHIHAPQFVVLNKGIITANAYEGDGGNIHIVSEQLIKSGDSIISVSSALGIDGNIKVESPDIDINAGFIRLDESFLDASQWVQTPCTYRTGESVSQFIISNMDASPIDYQNSWLIADEELKNQQPSAFVVDQSVKAYFDNYFHFYHVD